MQQLTAQRAESDKCRRQIQDAAAIMVKQNETLPLRIQNVIDDERRRASEDRQQLMNQITSLISAQAGAQESRLAEKTTLPQNDVLDFNTTFKVSVARYGDGMARSRRLCLPRPI